MITNDNNKSMLLEKEVIELLLRSFVWLLMRLYYEYQNKLYFERLSFDY